MNDTSEEMTIESVSVLQPGQEYRNYKELCAALQIAPKQGNSKKSDIKEFKRFFDFERKGNKFIITAIYDTPKPKEENGRNSKYKKYIECLLWNELNNKCIENGNNSCTLIYAFKDMAYNLFMVNDDFKPVHKDTWYDDNDITPTQYRSFYYQSKSMLVSYIKTALESMQDNHEIELSIEKIVLPKHGSGIRIMDTNEKKTYDKIFRNTLKHYESSKGKPCNTLQDLIYSGAKSDINIKRFYAELDGICIEKFGGKVVENIYVIDTDKEMLDLCKERIEEYDIATVGKELNRKLCDNFKESKTLLINHKAKQIVAQEGFGKPLVKNMQSYSILSEDERNILVDSIIYIDNKDIRKHTKAAIEHKGNKA